MSEQSPRRCKLVLLRTFAVTGIVRTVPDGYEISTDGGRTWGTFRADMVLSAIPINEKGDELV